MQTSSWKLGFMTFAAAALAAALAACGGGQKEQQEAPRAGSAGAAQAVQGVARSPGATAPPPMPPNPTPVMTAVPSPTPAASTPAPASAGPTAYNPNLVMWTIFAAPGHPAVATSLALEEARKHRDVSQVPIIIEMVRFVSSLGVISDMADTLEELTGQRFGDELPDWQRWMEWLGRNTAQYQPPEQYRQWKANLFSVLNPRFADFLSPDTGPTLIDLTEVVWGGVAPDGIPDIQDPRILTPDQAGYLSPDARVFGVSINGEHRAYPLRIVNAHEMANDVLGGEPIVLAY